jgi:hypothetical protein
MCGLKNCAFQAYSDPAARNSALTARLVMVVGDLIGEESCMQTKDGYLMVGAAGEAI